MKKITRVFEKRYYSGRSGCGSVLHLECFDYDRESKKDHCRDT